jgi:outer membrane protein assembly factor BamB
MLFVPSKGTTALRLVSDQEPPAVLWQSPQLIHSTVSPVVLKDRVYALNNAGILKCSAAKDGSRLWQLRTTGPYSATPVGAGDFLYLLNEKGLLQAVDPTAPEGAVASTLDLQDTFIATPSIGAKGLYLRSDKFLYCIKAR